MREPLILYKYMSLKRFMTSFKDYLDGKVWFADRESLNDPMENVPLSNCMSLGRFDLDQLEKITGKRLSFDESIRYHEESGKHFEDRKKELAEVKICSLSEMPDNFAMWSYYAENHTGVCVGFEIDSALVTPIDKYGRLEVNGIIIAKVKYTDKIPSIVLPEREITKKNTRDIYKYLFFMKMRNWKHEREWRLMTFGKKARMLKIGKVKEVLRGSKCPSVVAQCFTVEQRQLVKSAVIEQQQPRDKGWGWSIYVPKDGIEHECGKFSTLDWEYWMEERNVRIQRYIGSKPNAEMPAEIHGKPVTFIDGDRFNAYIGLSRVTIPSSVQYIHPNAFSCSDLTSIMVATGNTAFYSEDGVLFQMEPDREGPAKILFRYPPGKKEANYIIPDGVLAIGEYAFAECIGLTAVSIPDSVKIIGNDAFHGCTRLTVVNIPDSVEIIGDGAFQDCKCLNNETCKDIRKRFGDKVF